MTPNGVSRETALRRRPLPLITSGVVALILTAGALGWWILRNSDQAETLRRFASPDPKMRKAAAREVAEHGWPAAVEHMARALELGTEQDPDVRETFVYALGAAGEAEHFHIVATLAAVDPSGYVRQSAWRAAARLDGVRFRTLAEDHPPPEDAWDRLGLAAAWLQIAEPRGVFTLLELAQHGTPDQQLVACGVLTRGVTLLLEVAGQWPLGVEVEMGQLWPPELLAEVTERCHRIDLEAAAAQARPHIEAMLQLYRDTYRMTSARNHIAWFLKLF